MIRDGSHPTEPGRGRRGRPALRLRAGPLTPRRARPAERRAPAAGVEADALLHRFGQSLSTMRSSEQLEGYAAHLVEVARCICSQIPLWRGAHTAIRDGRSGAISPDTWSGELVGVSGARGLW